MWILQIVFLVAAGILCGDETVYGLMMTGKDAMREKFAQIAVRNFFEQKYPDLKLIIVNHSTEYSLGHLDERITEIKLDERPETIGTMRNIGLAQLEENDIFINWDDDDWRVPEMLPQMYSAMTRQRSDCITLTARIDYIFPCNTCYVRKRRSMSGLMMCRKKDIVYPEVEEGEDWRYLAKYKKRYRFTTLDNPPHWYLRFIHYGNITKPEGSRQYDSLPNYWSVTKDNRIYIQKSLQQYAWVYDELKIERPKFIKKDASAVDEEDVSLLADASQS